jgi:hypothetical protein
MHVGLGETQGGLGIWRGGYRGAMGDKREQFTSNLGPRWTIPITTGGCQVSKKKGLARGTCVCTYMLKPYSCIYTRMIEVMNDTSCMHDNNNQNEFC